jgi:hypothetical protein
MLRTVTGRPGGRRLLVSYLLAASLRCQASSVAGVTGKTPAQRRRGMNRVSAVNHARSAGSYRTRPGVPAQHRVLVPEHQQLGVLRLVPAEHQDSRAKSPAHEQAGDLEQHPASQPSPHHPFRRNGRPTMRSSFRAAQDPSTQVIVQPLGRAVRLPFGRPPADGPRGREVRGQRPPHWPVMREIADRIDDVAHAVPGGAPTPPGQPTPGRAVTAPRPPIPPPVMSDG